MKSYLEFRCVWSEVGLRHQRSVRSLFVLTPNLPPSEGNPEVPLLESRGSRQHMLNVDLPFEEAATVFLSSFSLGFFSSIDTFLFSVITSLGEENRILSISGREFGDRRTCRLKRFSVRYQ